MSNVKLTIVIPGYSLKELKSKYARFFGVKESKVKRSDISRWVAQLAKSDIDVNE